MNVRLLLILLLLTFNAHAANDKQTFTLSADIWAQPRSGKVVASFDAVRHAVEYWSKNRNQFILISYPSEDSGELWASELRDWIVSLGISKDYIILQSGLNVFDEINIEVGRQQDLNI